MNILITGAKGQLGSEIRHISSEFPSINFVFTDIDELDISNELLINSFFKNNSFDVLINCAAYTDVDEAEHKKDLANMINNYSVGYLALACKMNDIKMIHISTDYVFDGNSNLSYLEGDEKNPLNFYGYSKSEGENKILELDLKNSIIVRTSWLYSKFGNNFVKKILSLLENNNQIDIVCDQFGSPTNAADLALDLINIIEKINYNQTKIFHYCNKGKCSWYGFAEEIFRINKINIKLNPVSSDYYITKSRRPKYSVLNSSLFEKEFDTKINDWKHSLRKYFKSF